MEQKTTETTGQRQPRPVYYEPDHDGDANDKIAGVLHMRGYRLTSDESWLASLGVHAMVTVEGDGSWTLHDGDLGAHLPKLDEFASPEAYANAIADFLDGKTDGVYPAPDMAAEREAVQHYLRHLLAAAERAELAVGSRAGKVRDPRKSLRMAVADLVDEAQRLQKRLGEIEGAR